MDAPWLETLYDPSVLVEGKEVPRRGKEGGGGGGGGGGGSYHPKTSYKKLMVAAEELDQHNLHHAMIHDIIMM